MISEQEFSQAVTTLSKCIEQIAGIQQEASEQDDPVLDTKASARYLGTTPGNLRASRTTGTLFGKPTPEFLDGGGKRLCRLSTLNRFLDSLDKYRTTAELPAERKRIQIENLGRGAK